MRGSVIDKINEGAIVSEIFFFNKKAGETKSVLILFHFALISFQWLVLWYLFFCKHAICISWIFLIFLQMCFFLCVYCQQLSSWFTSYCLWETSLYLYSNAYIDKPENICIIVSSGEYSIVECECRGLLYWLVKWKAERNAQQRIGFLKDEASWGIS